MRFQSVRRICVLLLSCSAAESQQREPKELLARGIQLADLYNWDDAGPAFTEAEQIFVERGDQRNALYAKLGRIRANIEREQPTLPEVNAQLAEALDDDPLLQKDKELRLFCFIVKGDIDTEINTGAMKEDWTQVKKLAEEQGNSKWAYRALAQLGIAAFYDADLESARRDAGTALAAANKAGDVGAEVRILTILGSGLFESKMYEQALALVANALKIATANPDMGYPYLAEELHIQVLIALKQLDAAARTNQEYLARAEQGRRIAHEATSYGLAAEISEAQGDNGGALVQIQRAITLAESARLVRILAGMYGRAASVYRVSGDLENAQHFAELSATATQSSGNLWDVPATLEALAELQIARGRYSEADGAYERSEAFLGSMIGSASTRFEQTAVIAASSEIYSQHFALIADRLNDPKKAYEVIEQVRGRAAADLLASGMATPFAAREIERAVARLRLKLMAAQSTRDVATLRDEIFMEEQARWVTPGASVLKSHPRQTVALEDVQRSLDPSTVLLEYVMADSNGYCLAISRSGSRIVRLSSKGRIEGLVGSYLKAVKAKLPAIREARGLYDALIAPLHDALDKHTVIVVPDGQLHLVPFDALKDASGRFIVETKTVIYAPSASTYYLLSREQDRAETRRRSLLAVGGVPYAGSSLNRSGLTQGFNRAGFVDLPSSGDEVRIAQAAFRDGKVDLLVGPSATEAAFKAASLRTIRSFISPFTHLRTRLFLIGPL